MSGYRTVLVGLALVALPLIYGCAPTTLGDTTRPGKPPGTLITTDKWSEMFKASKANVVSKGENLDVTVTMETGETCATNLKLKEMVKSYPILSVLPGFSSDPYLLYTGKWGNDMPSPCLELIKAPGGTYVEARVGEDSMIMGGRPISLITKANPDDLDIQAKSGLTYYVPTVKGVDD